MEWRGSPMHLFAKINGGAMINIVNCLLTRRCNLNCSYCRISGNINYSDKPKEYPDGEYYFQSERPPEWWRDVIYACHEENPNAFVILYGGEPLLYEGLLQLLQYLHAKDIKYTIISNCTSITKSRRDKIISTLGGIKGFTASVDPGFERSGKKLDEILKSNKGYKILKEMVDAKVVLDPVAEMTCCISTISYAPSTIERLSEEGIWSDLTVLDIAKNPYYDFSTVTAPDALVPKNEEVKEIFQTLINSPFKIHMKEKLLSRIYDILPANLDCGFQRGNIHNITIDADGSLRLCLRIRGIYSPEYTADELFGNGRKHAEILIEADKQNYCKGCSWTCAIMSQMKYEDVHNH